MNWPPFGGGSKTQVKPNQRVNGTSHRNSASRVVCGVLNSTKSHTSQPLDYFVETHVTITMKRLSKNKMEGVDEVHPFITSSVVVHSIDYWVKEYQGPDNLLLFIWNYSLFVRGGDPIVEETYEEWIANVTVERANTLLLAIRKSCFILLPRPPRTHEKRRGFPFGKL